MARATAPQSTDYATSVRLKKRRASTRCAYAVARKQWRRASAEYVRAVDTRNRLAKRADAIEAVVKHKRQQLREHPKNRALVCSHANAAAKLRDAHTAFLRAKDDAKSATQRYDRASARMKSAMVADNRARDAWANAPYDVRHARARR